MKLITSSRKQILHAIRAACIALFLAACASKATAAGPFYNTTDFVLNADGVTVTGQPVMDANNAYFFDSTPAHGYTITVPTTSSFKNTNAGVNVIEIDHGTITNSGYLDSSTASGVYIHSSGSVTNSGTIDSNSNTAWSVVFGSPTMTGTGSVTNSGTMLSGYGIAFFSGDGVVNNTGEIAATAGRGVYIGGNGSVTNSNYIGGAEGGVYVIGNGTVTNTVGGIILASTGSTYAGVELGSGTVNNAGIVAADTTYGVHIHGDGTVNNTGNIFGDATNANSSSAVYIEGDGTVTNSSTGGIQGTDAGVLILGDGMVTNAGGIHGTTSGVYIEGNATVTNSGSISATYTSTGKGVYGLYAGGNGTITNTATGVISSDGSGTGTAYGVYVANNDAVVSNAGMIEAVTHGTASAYGIYLSGGGTITNTSSLYGIAEGTNGNGYAVYSAGGDVQNSGTISGYSRSGDYAVGVYDASGTVTNSGSIYATGITAGEAIGVQIQNSGMLINSGTISALSVDGSLARGVLFSGDGTLINEAGGTIAASGGAGSNVTTRGVDILGLGTVENAGDITALATGIDNAVGVYIESNSATIQNTGTIAAFNYDDASTYGIAVYANATVTNSGTISAYSKNEASYGIWVGGDNTKVTSTGGTISGTYSVYLSGQNDSLSVIGRTDMAGLMEGNNGPGNTLSLRIAGMTPAEAAIANGQNGHASGDFTANGYDYHWENFEGVNITAISLELAVDSGLLDVATKLDTTALSFAYDPLFAAAANNPEAALNNFTGREFLNAFSQLGLSTATTMGALADNRAFDLRSGSTGLDFAGLNVTSGSLIASLGSTASILDHLSSTRYGGVTMSDSKEMSEVAPSSPWAAWVSGTVTFADDTGAFSDPGYHATTGSPTFGFDYRLNHDFVLGALVNYTTQGAYFSDGSELDADTVLFGGYADWSHDNWYVNGLVAGGFTSYDQTRNTLGGGVATASPDGSEVIANVSGGYDFKVDGFTVSPIAGLNYTHLDKDSFTESGAGAFDLNTGEQEVDSLRTKLGFNVTHPFTWDGIKFAPEMHANWYHECLDNTNGVSVGVPGAGALGSFEVTTTPQGRDFALVGGGLSATPAELDNRVTFFVNYDAQVGQTDFIAHTVNGGVQIGF